MTEQQTLAFEFNYCPKCRGRIIVSTLNDEYFVKCTHCDYSFILRGTCCEVFDRLIADAKLPRAQHPEVDEVKVCPFCGGKPHIHSVYKNYVDMYDEEPVLRWKIMCGARVDCCTILNDYASPEDAIKDWNKRYRDA